MYRMVRIKVRILPKKIGTFVYLYQCLMLNVKYDITIRIEESTMNLRIPVMQLFAPVLQPDILEGNLPFVDIGPIHIHQPHAQLPVE